MPSIVVELISHKVEIAKFPVAHDTRSLHQVAVVSGAAKYSHKTTVKYLHTSKCRNQRKSSVYVTGVESQYGRVGSFADEKSVQRSWLVWLVCNKIHTRTTNGYSIRYLR